jgi:hypothetical protein
MRSVTCHLATMIALWFSICPLGSASCPTTHHQVLSIEAIVEQGGLVGRVQTLIDDHEARYRRTFKLGVNSGADGYDGSRAWSQDSAGQVRLEEAEDAMRGAIDRIFQYRLFRPCLFTKELKRTQRTARIDGRAYRIFLITPENGRPLELWIDASTRQLSRSIEQTAFEPVTTRYADFRTVSGFRVPFKIRISNGRSRFDRVERIESVTIVANAGKSLFSVPPDPPPDFVFPSGESRVTVPFRLMSNLVVIDAQLVGSKQLPFILDTGGVDLVFPETVQALRLNSEGRLWGFGGGAADLETSQTEIEGMKLGPIQFAHQIFMVYPFPDLRTAIGVPELSGILGYEIFKRFTVRIDYPNRLITLCLPEIDPFHRNGVVVPFRFNTNIPQVDGEIDGIPSRIDIDTGNTGSLVLYSPWVRSHGLVGEGVEATKGAAGGTTEFSIRPYRSLKLGEMSFGPSVAALSHLTTGALANPYGAGVVGAGVLQGHVVTFDYRRRRIIFE